MKTIKNILIAPDKFKFTLTAPEVTDAISIGLSAHKEQLNIQKIPLADGGEGTSDILSTYFRADKIYLNVNNPIFKTISAYYYFSLEKKTAIINVSNASGLDLLRDKDRNPMFTSSYGTGEMIIDAVNKGAKKIILGLGGSATNDLGIGAANAIGYRFLSKSGKLLKPIGKNLINISEIDDSQVKVPLNEIEIISLYDVENVLYGKNGAAYVFAKQKGANEEEISVLDEGLKHLAGLVKTTYRKDVSSIIGGGAAGGFGAGSLAFLNAILKPGSKTIFNIVGIEEHLKNCDLIITGEGKFDKQSLQGKVTGELIKKSEKYKIPIVVICGIQENSKDFNEIIKKNNLLTVLPLYKKPVDLKIAKQDSPELIKIMSKFIIELLEVL